MKRTKKSINQMLNNESESKSVKKVSITDSKKTDETINKLLKTKRRVTKHSELNELNDNSIKKKLVQNRSRGKNTKNIENQLNEIDDVSETNKIIDQQKTNTMSTSILIPEKKYQVTDEEHSRPSANLDTMVLSQEIKQELENNKKIRLTKMIIPWTEKYRPSKLEDLLIDNITKEKLTKIIRNREMPNILITGGPGEGKTSTILLIANMILGLNYKEAFLELNASDERGIKTHTSVTDFCKKKLHFNEEKMEEYAKHKIILLDEADNMTKKGQQSISNLMEQFKHTTRFAFTCNNSGDIIEAIQSRCMIFRYNKLNQEQITQRLTYICKNEGIKYTEDGIKSLVLISDGDMRNAVNNLQVMYNSHAYNLNGGITQKNVYKLSDKPKPQVIKRILLLCYKKDIRNAIIEINVLRDKGYSTADILNCMQNLIIYDEVKEIDVKTLHYYLRETSKTLHTINQGIDTNLQLNSCVIALCNY